MKKIHLVAVGLAGIVAISLISIAWLSPMSEPIPTKALDMTPSSVALYENASYLINGTRVTLVNGVSEEPAAPGSASNIITRYFGNVATGDLNNDGVPDAAFLLTQETGGSGTFYYVVAAVKSPRGLTGTDAVLLGDRIAPQTTEIHAGKIIVNYADRAPGESMTAQPSVGKSTYFILDGTTLREVSG